MRATPVDQHRPRTGAWSRFARPTGRTPSWKPTSWWCPELTDSWKILTRGRFPRCEAPPTNGARVASLCVGAFTLAATGLLDGRRATTHWQFAGELARRYPDIDVDPSVLFVDEGPVLTSAGVASGMDLCLHLIRQHAGADLAGTHRAARGDTSVARRRPGPVQRARQGPADAGHPLQPTIAWMEENAGSLTGFAGHRPSRVGERADVKSPIP